MNQNKVSGIKKVVIRLIPSILVGIIFLITIPAKSNSSKKVSEIIRYEICEIDMEVNLSFIFFKEYYSNFKQYKKYSIISAGANIVTDVGTCKHIGKNNSCIKNQLGEQWVTILDDKGVLHKISQDYLDVISRNIIKWKKCRWKKVDNMSVEFTKSTHSDFLPKCCKAPDYQNPEKLMEMISIYSEKIKNSNKLPVSQFKSE